MNGTLSTPHRPALRVTSPFERWTRYLKYFLQRIVTGILFIIVLLSQTSMATPDAATGGLLSFPTPSATENLLTNSGFELGVAPWTLNKSFSVDTTVSHSGQSSLTLADSNLVTLSQQAGQVLQLKQGVYNCAGWIKVSGLDSSGGKGVRICLQAPITFPWSLVNACSPVASGTADWQYLQVTNIVVPQDTPALFSVQPYGRPAGTAWIDDLNLTRQLMPLQSFMLYPNYRGMLFDDQSQIALFNVSVDPPVNTSVNDFVLSGTVTNEVTGTVLQHVSFPAETSATVSFDLSSLTIGTSSLVTFQLTRPDSGQSYTYPAYRIVKVPGTSRKAMVVSFDDQNRFLLHGKPAFLLGVYDSGMGYPNDEQTWKTQLTTQRRLFELPINFYLNYWYGAAPNSSILPLMNVLYQNGIYNLTNANCTSATSIDTQGGWFMKGPDAVIQQRAAHPGFAGFYSADECVPSLVSNVFSHYQQMKALDPDGITFAALLNNSNLPLWRDTVDILSTDPYPLYGQEPAGGYALAQVADATLRTQNVLMGGRPFVTVVQFFQFTANSRWPTQSELRSMSYAAIVGGANGLFYWSLGTGALAYICDGKDSYHSPSGAESWCQAKIDNFTNLKTVLFEMKGLENVLTLPDRPDLLTGTNNSKIRTRVKYDGKTAYVIAFNASNSPQAVTFRFGSVPKDVSQLRSGRPFPLRGSLVDDSIGPYDAQIYRLEFPSSIPRPARSVNLRTPGK